MMSWTDLLTALKWAFEHRKDIGQVASLAKWWRKSERPILIIGPGGVGKSTLGQFLSGRDIRWEYSESRKQEEYPLRDDPRVGVIVPPGQKHRRPAYWPDVHPVSLPGSIAGSSS